MLDVRVAHAQIACQIDILNNTNTNLNNPSPGRDRKVHLNSSYIDTALTKRHTTEGSNHIYINDILTQTLFFGLLKEKTYHWLVDIADKSLHFKFILQF